MTAPATTTRDTQRGVTEAGMKQLFAFIRGVRPHQPLTREVAHAWRLKLDEHGVNDRDAIAAASSLADNEDGRDIPVGAVIHHAQLIRNRRHIASQAEQRELAPYAADTATPWDGLTDTQRDEWIGQAVDAFRGYTTNRESPIIQGFARHLANGGATEPAPGATVGRCRGCGGQLELVDRGTATAKCRRCHSEFVLTTNAEHTLPIYWTSHSNAPLQTCSKCPATLIGYDPPGGQCRHCAPRRKANA